jgi:hypothetical protein
MHTSILKLSYIHNEITRCRSWLRHCATSRKVAGSISDAVNGIFHSHNPFGRTMALGLIQPLTETSKGVGLTTLPPSYAYFHEILEPQPPGMLRACNGIALIFLYIHNYSYMFRATIWSPWEI